MICKKCGAQIDDNAVECQFCGATYEENVVPEPIEEETAEGINETETADNEPVEDETLGVAEDETDIDELMDENEAKRQKQVERLNAEKQSQIKEIEKRRKVKKFRQKRNKVIVAVIVIAIIAALGGGGYMIWKESNEEPDIIIATQTPTSTPSQTVAVSPTPTATAVPSESPLPEESAQPSIRPITPTQAPAGGNSQASSDVQTATVKPVAPSTQKPNIRPVETKKPASVQQSGGANVQSGNQTSSQVSVSGVKPNTSNVSFGGKEYSSEGGFADGKFSAALVTGVEVVNNGEKSYMSFKFNGATYYANVSATTTTKFVSGRPMTVSAYKTSESYNGAPIYEITAITNYTGKNILPNSGFELLTEADVAGLSPAELRLARNEIYARHGRSFKDAEIRKYFESCSWYKVKKSYNYSNESANLNSIEKANINFILKHEK